MKGPKEMLSFTFEHLESLEIRGTFIHNTYKKADNIVIRS